MENIPMVPRGGQRIHFWHIVILVTVVVLGYGHIGSFDFLYLWDDQWQVINDRTSGGITGSNLKTIFATSEYGQYSPINQLYYTAIYLFGGYNPRWFHWGSVVLHILNTVLVYYMGYRLLCSLAYSRKVGLYCALIASLLVAIHPVNVEAVCWVSASKVLLGCFFYYLSILAYCRYVCTGRKSFFVIGIAFAFLSAGSKEQVVTLAVCLLLIDRYVFGRSLSSWSIYAEKLYYVLPAVCIFFPVVLSLSVPLYGGRGYYFVVMDLSGSDMLHWLFTLSKQKFPFALLLFPLFCLAVASRIAYCPFAQVFHHGRPLSVYVLCGCGIACGGRHI